MSSKNLVEKLTCSWHAVPKGEYKENYNEDYIREAPNTELTIYKKEENDILMKVIWLNERYHLIRDKNGKMDVWQIKTDFNHESAIAFMDHWDKMGYGVK